MARNGALILIFFISVSQFVSFSTARSFPEGFDGVIFSGDISVISKAMNGKSPATVVGCGGESDHFTASSQGDYVTGKFGSLVLNVLPKGSVPASGPSKRINDVKT